MRTPGTRRLRGGVVQTTREPVAERRVVGLDERSPEAVGCIGPGADDDAVEHVGHLAGDRIPERRIVETLRRVQNGGRRVVPERRDGAMVGGDHPLDRTAPVELPECHGVIAVARREKFTLIDVSASGPVTPVCRSNSRGVLAPVETSCSNTEPKSSAQYRCCDAVDTTTSRHGTRPRRGSSPSGSTGRFSEPLRFVHAVVPGRQVDARRPHHFRT